MSQFLIGDKVIAIIDNPDDNENIVSGDAGTVCALDTLYNRIGVRWDKRINGHNCNLSCEYGYGWWVDESAISLSQSVIDEPFEFDEDEFEKLLFIQSKM